MNDFKSVRFNLTLKNKMNTIEHCDLVVENDRLIKQRDNDVKSYDRILLITNDIALLLISQQCYNTNIEYYDSLFAELAETI